MANLTHWNPFKPLTPFESRVPMFGDFFRDFGMRPREAVEGSYAVKAEIPGVDKNDIDVSIDGNQVSISAEVKRETSKKDDERDICTERYYGQVYRSFSLPGDVDSEKADARYENGLLTLTLPKKENGSARKLTVS